MHWECECCFPLGTLKTGHTRLATGSGSCLMVFVSSQSFVRKHHGRWVSFSLRASGVILESEVRMWGTLWRHLLVFETPELQTGLEITQEPDQGKRCHLCFLCQAWLLLSLMGTLSVPHPQRAEPRSAWYRPMPLFLAWTYSSWRKHTLLCSTLKSIKRSKQKT